MSQRKCKGFMLGVITIGFWALTAVTAGPSQAASGNGPYYAEPSWSQKLPTATRFVVLTDWNSEAVLDRETGLVWEKEPPTSFRNWFNARFECTNRRTGSRKGWRLPSVHELASLLDPAVAVPGPTLPPGHPFSFVQSVNYWSASSAADSPTLAWFVSFRNGDVLTGGKAFEIQVWCVRGGSNADQY